MIISYIQNLRRWNHPRFHFPGLLLASRLSKKGQLLYLRPISVRDEASVSIAAIAIYSIPVRLDHSDFLTPLTKPFMRDYTMEKEGIPGNGLPGIYSLYSIYLVRLRKRKGPNMVGSRSGKVCDMDLTIRGIFLSFVTTQVFFMSILVYRSTLVVLF